MRISRSAFQRRVKGTHRIEFGEHRLTSFAGLELVLRFVQRIGLRERLHALGRRLALGGDVRFGSMVLLLVGMLLIGAKRLRHVRFVDGDPMVRRFAGMARVPGERTLARFLGRFRQRHWRELDALNEDLVWQALEPLDLKRVTLDIDGVVLCTGLQAERAFRGYNPHHRKNPSYYPITIQIAQTGHLLAHQNRSGDVHDSKGAARYLQETVTRVRERGFGGVVEFRADSAFFQRRILEVCDRSRLEYAIKVPMWPWLNLKTRIRAHAPEAWECVDPANKVEGFFMDLPIAQWTQRTERVGVFRKRVNHKTKQCVQLDLFNPDDGRWEYSVIATNKTLGLKALWRFAHGHSAQEKAFAELRGGYAFDAIPTKRYGANTAWQKLNVLAYNLMTSFQLETTARPKPRSLRRTSSFVIQSIRTLRFTWLGRAARLINRAGQRVLKLAADSAVREVYEKIEAALPWDRAEAA